MKKFFLINDNTKKALNFKKKLLKKIKNHNPKKADIFLVAGGDGFMLNTLKKY